MSNSKEVAKPTTIADFWAKSEKEITDAQKAKRLKALKLDGEIALAKLENEAEAAEVSLESAIIGASVGSHTMDNLFQLKRAVKIARAKHTDAVKDYEEMFGEKPKLQ